MNLTKLSYTVSLVIVGLGLAINGHSQSFLTNGLIAYYPFNGNANDASGNGHDGFAENTYSTTNQFGQPNSALSFAGDAWVYVPYSASLFTTNYTVSLIFNSQTTFSNFCIIRSGNASTDSFRGYSLSEGYSSQYFGFADYNGTGQNACYKPIGYWQQNTWYNITYTRGGTVGQLYLNGVVIASVTNTTPYAPAQNSPLYIGSNAHDPATSDPTVTPTWCFAGIIYDVRLYNRALSNTEVQQLYIYESGPQVNLIKAVKPSFSNLTLTTNYQLQVSSDLSNWTNQGSVFTATNTSMVYPQYWDVDNWNSLFFRLQVAP